MEGLGVANLRFEYCDGFLVLNFPGNFSNFFLLKNSKEKTSTKHRRPKI
jgi:hypothetical protein